MNVSRDLIGAIHDAADSAVDTAAQFVPGRHRRHWATRPTTIAAAAVIVLAVVALLLRSRTGDDAGDSQAPSGDRSGAGAADGSRASSDDRNGEPRGDGRERDRVGARSSSGAGAGDSVQPPIPD